MADVPEFERVYERRASGENPEGKVSPQAISLEDHGSGGLVLFTANSRSRLREPSQALDELLEITRITSQPGWQAAAYEFAMNRIAPVTIARGMWTPASVRGYPSLLRSLPIMLMQAAPFLWRDSPTGLALEMAKSLPPETVWRRDMLVEPIMYWAQETDRVMDPHREGVHPGRTNDSEAMVEAGLARMYSSLIVDSDALLELAGSLAVHRGHPNVLSEKGGITSVRFMIADTGLLVPLPGVSLYGTPVGSAMFLASELLFMTSKLSGIEAHVPAKPFRKRWERQSRGQAMPTVRVVGLRRRDRPQVEGEHVPVDWAYRWLVHAHWHKYHTRDGVVTKMVGDYLKGPEEKPLKVAPRVYHVNR